MSWNNIVPWSFFYRGDHHIRALESCAFVDEVKIWEFRDDWANRFPVKEETRTIKREDW